MTVAEKHVWMEELLASNKHSKLRKIYMRKIAEAKRRADQYAIFKAEKDKNEVQGNK